MEGRIIYKFEKDEPYINLDFCHPKPHFSPLITTPAPEPRRDILIAPLLYEYIQHCWMMIPAGLNTDYASIPRFLWPIMSPWGRYREAAVVHDYLYQNLGHCMIFLGTRGQEKPKWKIVYRRLNCDKIFYKAMKWCGVPDWKRLVMYKGVRLGGWKAWNNYKKRKEKKHG